MTTMSITYLTDREMLSRYLPEGFEVGQEPLMTVSYSLNREIEWLAGSFIEMLSHRLVEVEDVVVLQAVENVSSLLAVAGQSVDPQGSQLMGDSRFIQVQDRRYIPHAHFPCCQQGENSQAVGIG